MLLSFSKELQVFGIGGYHIRFTLGKNSMRWDVGTTLLQLERSNQEHGRMTTKAFVEQAMPRELYLIRSRERHAMSRFTK